MLAFIVISIGIIVIPGPNVLVVVSTSITHGKVRGLQTVAGTSTAMLVQLTIAALGTSWFVSTLANGFVWLKWMGIIYLLYLGASHLLATHDRTKTQISAFGSFHRGFWVSLTNPKTILFFSAFLPQFTNPAVSYQLQIAVLSSIFLFLAVVLDSGYALIAHKLLSILKSKSLNKYRHGVSGVLYLSAGTMLATTKNG